MFLFAICIGPEKKEDTPLMHVSSNADHQILGRFSGVESSWFLGRWPSVVSEDRPTIAADRYYAMMIFMLHSKDSRSPCGALMMSS